MGGWVCGLTCKSASRPLSNYPPIVYSSAFELPALPLPIQLTTVGGWVGGWVGGRGNVQEIMGFHIIQPPVLDQGSGGPNEVLAGRDDENRVEVSGVEGTEAAGW